MEVVCATGVGDSGEKIAPICRSEPVDGPGLTATASAPPQPRDETHRRLRARHIQLMGIGGTIGTVLFVSAPPPYPLEAPFCSPPRPRKQVQIGKGLVQGGPGSLVIAFSFWCTVVLAVTLCAAEMVTLAPVPSPFARLAGALCDEALGFAAGWNYLAFEAVLVPFEVTACGLVVRFWTDAVPPAAVAAIVVALYALLNLLAVRWFGEAEFWAAVGKVLLVVGLVAFTLVAMLGGNPEGDRFGFRYWSHPGAFAELYYPGALGRWLGFLQCLILAAFTIAGPDYVSMAASEAVDPRRVMPRAYNAVFYRLTAFFVLGSLCVGILVPYDDAALIHAFASAAPGAAASPYVVAMNRLHVRVLPHVVNAAVLTAAFSAGNSYVYCASRSLYGLAIDGKAPRLFARCSAAGVPVYCVLAVLLVALLSFLQLSSGTAAVLNWFISLVTASQLINFAVVCVTYLCFRRACAAQGIRRDALPYRAWLMPYAAYYALAWTTIMALVGGYTVFLPGKWNLPDFLFSCVESCPLFFFSRTP